MFDIIGPRQTCIVSSRARIKQLGRDILKDDLITLDWHMPLSMSPQLYAIAVGKTRFSLKLIRQSQVFAVNFLSHKHEKAAMICGTYSGEHMEKFEKANLKKTESKSIDCPRIEDAAAYLECSLEQELDAGDHVILVGKVLDGKNETHDRRLIHLSGDRFL